MAYYTPGELRGRYSDLADRARWPDAELEENRQLVEESLERAARVAFEPRSATQTLSGHGHAYLRAMWPRLRRVLTAEVDGVALDPGATRVDGCYLVLAAGWPEGVANVRVTYEHGYDEPPRRLRRAALILAKNWLIRGPIDDRATQVLGVEGGVINLATPGVFGSVFGLPEVDAVIADLREDPPTGGVL